MIETQKRRLLATGLLVALVIGVVLSFNQLVAADTSARPAEQGTNLLQNPGFEGPFHAWNGINELQVANSWTPWWWEDPDHNPAYFRPEYKRALAAVFPDRVLAGESAQQWFTFHASHFAGMYQQVFSVEPGQRYRFSIWAQVWSSIEDDPYVSVLPANPHLRVGIDPTGNWNPGSGEIVWSPEGSMTSFIDQWAQISVEATANNSVITVFMRTNPDFANKHNDMYWDNASLVVLGPPPPPPTNTPLPATNTPEAGNTPPATDLPIATATPIASNTPVATATPEATATPLSSDTPTPSETPTTVPTDTPLPSATATKKPATSTPAAAEIIANSTTVPNGTSPADGSTADESNPLDYLSSFTGLVLIGLGIAIGLALAGVIFLMRRGGKRVE